MSNEVNWNPEVWTHVEIGAANEGAAEAAARATATATEVRMIVGIRRWKGEWSLR